MIATPYHWVYNLPVMGSKKCRQCGLINFADADNCQRCNTSLQVSIPLEVLSPQTENNRYRCPNCGSENTKMLSLIYSEGQKVGGDATVSSALAKPPSNKANSNAGILAVIFVGTFIASYLLFLSYGYSALVGLLTAVLATFGAHYLVLSPITRKHQNSFESEIRQWENTACCLRCDHQFFP